MNFKSKRWGSYKKWEDHSYIYFDKIARGLMIFRPKPQPVLLSKLPIIAYEHFN